MSTPSALTIDHPAVRLCAAYRFTSLERALAFLNDFTIERVRWCAAAAEGAWIWRDSAVRPSPAMRPKYLRLIEEMKRVMEEFNEQPE